MNMASPLRVREVGKDVNEECRELHDGVCDRSWSDCAVANK